MKRTGVGRSGSSSPVEAIGAQASGQAPALVRVLTTAGCTEATMRGGAADRGDVGVGIDRLYGQLVAHAQGD